MQIQAESGQGPSIVRSFPKTFWVANVMEIFERMAWYGFFAVSSLYITGRPEEGGLGLSEEDRGFLQGVVTFFLYLFPVVTGALADRYGFRKTLFCSYLLLTPGYLLLGQFNSFWGFFGAFMFVAVGAAVFKPVIVGTVARATDKRSASLGFGIFYMMVNVGGFLGPVVAGVVRGWGWRWVFVMSAVWISVNFLLLLFYLDPPGSSESERSKSLKQVMTGMVEVLGNGRFFVTTFGVLALLVLGARFVGWSAVLAMTAGWVVVNLLWDVVCRRQAAPAATGPSSRGHWLREPMRVGDWRFVTFLVLMSGFYASFNQLFITLPVYIRDFTDTAPLFELATGAVSAVGLNVAPESLRAYLLTPAGVFKPEYLININAGCIVLFQILVSWAFRQRRPFFTILFGLGLVTASFLMFTVGGAAWAVVAGIVVFSFGEMMASPKAKEYVGRIAPPHRVALYMGYFFWCMALGNLISGVLSGQLYGWLARDLGKPELMWAAFAGLAVITGVGVVLYDRFVVPSHRPGTQALAADGSDPQPSAVSRDPGNGDSASGSDELRGMQQAG